MPLGCTNSDRRRKAHPFHMQRPYEQPLAPLLFKVLMNIMLEKHASVTSISISDHPILFFGAGFRAARAAIFCGGRYRPNRADQATRQGAARALVRTPSHTPPSAPACVERKRSGAACT